MTIRSRLGRIGGTIFKLPPPAILAVMYFAMIVVGSLLLALPMSRTGPMTLGEAIFTATSAVTVTGLVLYDTGSQFTFFGQLVIITLIQIGGLGLMTFAVLFFSALGLPVGMSHKTFLREDLNQTSVSNLIVLVRIILKVALICEGIGIVLLAFVFMPEFGVWRGLWNAVFHAISAFNNAGFALYPDSLSRWVGNPVINLVIPALFIVGGIGFVVIGDVLDKRRWSRLMLHSKLMLFGTLALTVWATVTFAALEWQNPGTLGRLPDVATKLQAAWFQAVSPRTAGFNTVDITQMHDSTTLMVMTLMLIGGGSTSTAGGIKVTTFLVLLLATTAFFKRRTALHAFGRSLGLNEVLKVMALTTIVLLLVMVALFVISITHDGEFRNLAFEVTSAFGTVGLSRGTTSELDGIGRTVIILVMFLGRVGPLTLGFFLATQSRPRVRYPAGEIYLG